MYDLIIIGAGPAGMTAALYALRSNKKVLLLEAKNYGGQIVNAEKVENYPGISIISGFDYATNLYNQIKNLGVEFKREVVLSLTENRVVTTNKGTYQAKAIIIATGVESRNLNLDREKELIGKGVSYCATCDGHFYKDKVVAVVGGGNTALEDALYLSNIASKVYLIHRRSSFSGEEKYIEEVKHNDNIVLMMNCNVIKLIGNDVLESIDIKDNKGNINNVKVAGIFVAIGQVPKNTIFKNIVDLDEKGYIVSKDGVHTNKEKIYVAGDTRQKILRQLTTAVADGALAATIAINEMRDE